MKIEPPDADLTRFIVPNVDGFSPYFAQFNVGKECVSLDLTQPAGRDVLLSMVPKADIVLENYRPGVLDKLGLGYDVLSEINPGIIVGVGVRLGARQQSQRPGSVCVGAAR